MAHSYLVTGGAGFIGSNLVEALVERGDDVRVVDNFSTGQPANIQSVAGRIEMIEGDLTDPDVAKRTCRGIEVVFHLAALPGVAISLTKPMDSIRHGLVTTANVLEAAREAGVRRLVYSSSASVYGGRGPFPQREDSTPHACSPYGATKVCSEVCLRTFCDAFSVDGVSLRYFNVFGPRQPVDSSYAAVIPAFVARMSSGKRPVVYGDGTQTRDFAYISDVVRANLLAADYEGVLDGQAINVASGKGTSLLELVKAVNRVLGTDLLPAHEAARAGDVKDSVADISRAREVLGYTPEIGLVEGLRLTASYPGP